MRRRSILAAVAVLATSLTSLGGSPPPVHAAAVPPGFTDSFVAGVSRPTAVEWLPNDLIVVLEQSGRIRIGPPGGPFTTALTLSGVCSSSEKGLLGFTHDPAFFANGFVYVYYTRSSGGSCVNRVSRLTLTGTTINRASEVVLIDDISAVNGNHNGGDLDIGSDGNLYVGVGDAGRDPRGDSGSAGANDAAQDASLLNGKILRVRLDGSPVPGNPFTGPGSAVCRFRGNRASTPPTPCQEIYAIGLRNPYRIAFDRNDGSDRFFINDVGQRTYEEVDAGAITNYGWPSREGPCPQGQTTPCPGPPAGVTDPITAYRRIDGNRYITGGAFVPNGLWPKEYDGGYLFGDGGSGRIWLRRADGSVDYGAPFATGAFGLTDMTFGFDAAGRSVLYYVEHGGALRVITPPIVAPTPPTGLKVVPVTPFRAYDTGPGIGAAAGRVHNGTTRLVDLDPPAGVRAALVNLTYDATAGPGWVRTWVGRGLRPATSSLNADRAGTTAANAAIVPLDADGAFVLESSTSARVVVDVMAWLYETGGSSRDGRLAALDPVRLADSRSPAGTPLEGGSPNPWSRAGDTVTVDVAGVLGVPADGTADAVVVSIAAIGHPAATGWVGAYPGNTVYPGTSNVNTGPGDTRANLAIVPLGDDGTIDLRTFNVPDVVVDQLGYITSGSAPLATAGLYSATDPTRLVDTRVPIGFGPMAPLVPQTAAIPGGASASAVVQNLTVTETGGSGFVATYPGTTLPLVSSLNYSGPGQTRAVLAITRLTGSGVLRYTSFAPTHLVVDVTGTFSE